MSDISITCPECGVEFELTESLAAPLLEDAKADYEAKLAQKNKELAKQKREMDDRRSELEKAEAALDKTISERLAAEKPKLAAAEAKKARAAFELELQGKADALSEAETRLKAADQSLKAAKETEAAYKKKERDLEDRERSLQLTIQEKVDDELKSSRTAIRAEVEREANLKLRAKDVLMESMQTEIENLKRKSDQGSQQTQGEAMERELMDVLSAKFPQDTFTRVPKGVSGGDCMQQIYNSSGKLCGTILWESKNTKNWGKDWLSKLKGDQRAAKADTAILISNVLPEEVTHFAQMEGLWVTGWNCLVPVANSLRHLLIEIASTRRANEGHKEKAALVYEYVTSSGFKHRVQALVETFSAMQNDLNQEQRVIGKQWAKRQAQLDRMSEATTGMYGDLQGIAGNSVPELEGIGFDALEAGS
jgi:hypothetical protein